ncbi:MAG TPA: FAD:protein FMN transferase [Streptosporangiaceae bacterium]|jgi:thiamine biosynthesis lipoprotein
MPGQAATHAEHVMGTVVSFAVVPGGLAATETRAAVETACAGLHRADTVFSTWDAGSPVSRLRRGEATLGTMPPEVAEVLDLCELARTASHGWFDPWAMPGGIDPTGLVKGWAVERAADVLRRAGVAAALVNGGGDLTAFGSPGPGQPWLAGIRHPWRADALACIVEVRSAVATSATYERGGHLIDPFAGRPAVGVASATVTGPSLAMADALATALAVGGDDALAAIGGIEGYEGYLIRADGSEADSGDIRFVK